MSVAGGVLILFIVVIRALAIHRLPKTTFLALWMIAALRLLLPLSIPMPFKIHIDLDVFFRCGSKIALWKYRIPHTRGEPTRL